MSRQSANTSRTTPSRRANGAHAAETKVLDRLFTPTNHGDPQSDLFTRFAQAAARWSGRPVTFLIALVLILVWAASGPLFGYSDTWQLVVNTSTTIITFLMVFLIQNTQNRDTMALQIKLAELIIAMRGAHNQLAAVEDLSEAELEALHEEYRGRAQSTLDSLSQRRGTRSEG